MTRGKLTVVNEVQDLAADDAVLVEVESPGDAECLLRFSDSKLVNSAVHEVLVHLQEDKVVDLFIELRALSDEGVPLYSEEGVWAVLQGVMVNRSLQRLSISPGSMPLTVLPKVLTLRILRALAIAASDHPTLTELDLSGCVLKSPAAVGIANALLRNPQLNTVVLAQNDVQSAGAIAVSKALPFSKGIRVLDLSFNGISEEAAEAIGRALARTAQLEELNLSGNDLGDLGLSCLFKTACGVGVSQIRVLKLNSCGLGDRAAQSLALFLHKCPKLERLDLSGNRISDLGGRFIAEALSQNVVQRLNLQNNLLSDEFARNLSSYVLSYPKLVAVNLASNHIGTQGARYIADALETNSTLTELHLGSNKILSSGLSQFIPVILSPVSNLTSLFLSDNDITDEHCNSFFKSLDRSRLVNLDLSGNSISGRSMPALAASLRSSSSGLIWLNLMNNAIDEIGAKLLLRGVRDALKLRNAKLVSVQVSGNLASKDVLDKIEDPTLPIDQSLEAVSKNIPLINTPIDVGNQPVSQVDKDGKIENTSFQVGNPTPFLVNQQ